jgi:nucleoside-diphosphate-sugar epimerase
MKTVFVTGVDGYCGWPIILRQLKETDDRVIGCDYQFRREWVNEIGSDSVLPIRDISERVNSLKNIYGDRFEYVVGDLRNYSVVHSILERFKPDVVTHVASQPSAPYSSIDVGHATYTQHNNLSMLLNIMWGLNDLKLDNTHLIVTTTTGIYGAPDFDIPEGWLVVNEMEMPFPGMAGSWYHMSRAFDAGNLWLGNRQFKFPISELRTSIVCGSSTTHTREKADFVNRFDIDFYFGVVLHRFVAQAIAGKGLTIYGKGLQKKPMISLEDMARSTVNCSLIDPTDRERKYEIYNQMEDAIAIVDLANAVKSSVENRFNHEVKVEHIPNPRIEDEEHQMVMDNDRFLSDLAGFGFDCTVLESIDYMCNDLYSYKDKIVNLLRK